MATLPSEEGVEGERVLPDAHASDDRHLAVREGDVDALDVVVRVPLSRMSL